MNLIHCCNCLDCCSWRFAPFVLLLLPTLSFLVSPLVNVPHSPQNRNRLSDSLLSFLPLPFSLPFPFLPFLPFPFVPFTCPMSALTCQGSCAAQGHHRFSVPASTLARKHARLGKTHGLPREPLSGDHGRLLARVPSQSLLGPLAGGLCLRQFCTVHVFSQEASMSPRSRASLYIFSYLARGLRIPLKSAAADFQLCPHTLP